VNDTPVPLVEEIPLPRVEPNSVEPISDVPLPTDLENVQPVWSLPFPDHKVNNIEILISFLSSAKRVTFVDFVAFLYAMGIKKTEDLEYVVSFVVIRDSMVFYLPHWEQERREHRITTERENRENLELLIIAVNQYRPEIDDDDDDFFFN